MMNKLIVSEAHVNEKGEKLFLVEAEFDYELRKTGFFEIENDDEIKPFNFTFERVYDDETRQLLTLLMNRLDDIKKLFNYFQYDKENMLVIKQG